MEMDRKLPSLAPRPDLFNQLRRVALLLIGQKAVTLIPSGSNRCIDEALYLIDNERKRRLTPAGIPPDSLSFCSLTHLPTSIHPPQPLPLDAHLLIQKSSSSGSVD